MGLALAQGKLLGRERSQERYSANLKWDLTGKCPSVLTQWVGQLQDVFYSIQPLVLLSGIGPQLSKVVPCSLMHLFFASLPPRSHLSISPLVLPGITSSANYLHANLSMEVCFLETDPNTAKHGQSAFWEEGTALAKAQRYDRACLVWGSERSWVWLQSRSREIRRELERWKGESRMPGYPLWRKDGGFRMEIFKKSPRWFSDRQGHCLGSREKEDPVLLLSGAVS